MSFFHFFRDWQWNRMVRRHRKWMKKNRILMNPHPSTRRNGTEAVT